LILDNFGIVGSLFSAVYKWIRLTSLFILIVFWAQKTQNINPCVVRTDQLAADRRMYIAY
jgi:hypothetical protein